MGARRESKQMAPSWIDAPLSRLNRMLKTQEHYDLMAQFEREFKGRRLDKEPRDGWARGIIYQDGHINELFLAYRRGYALGKAVGRDTSEAA